ncbi:cation-translocating P-type ATPase [Roseivirga sp. BDSF3-8]|uniref:cation-translocating P-type ATPase n=1 Tax=Roseivirga sp. BDSF3-8 TaxID=3241598 RepID=UPI003531C977
MNTTSPLQDTHALEAEEVLQKLEANKEKGLSESEAESRLKKYGPNKLKESKTKSIWKILLDQVNNPVVYLLVAATTIAFIFGDTAEAIAIVVVIVVNAVIGFWMEFQAQKSVQALKEMDKITGRVRRDGKDQEIDAERIVPGDILVIDGETLIPADARLIEESELAVDEAALTGESLPVEKNIEKLEENTQTADRLNMVYKGTAATSGHALGVVVATGMETEIGNISQMVEDAGDEEVPLNSKLNKLTHKLIYVTLGMSAAFFLIGKLSGEDTYQLVQTSIAWAIAAIPEGLPIVASIALARGMLRLAKQNVIVKKLAAVETLGETTVIFTDKTGTLTENKLSVHTLAVPGADVHLELDHNDTVDVSTEENENIRRLTQISVACNNAELIENEEEQGGDPLELALLRFARMADKEIYETLLSSERVDEEPFDSDSKIMGTVDKLGDGYFIAAKGAVEAVLDRCDKLLENGEEKEMTEELREKWATHHDELAGDGLRVLAFGYREQPEAPSTESADGVKKFVDGLTFAGYIGFLDPPREDAAEAIQTCRDAGITVVMVTGDHPGTASNIAKRVKLLDEIEDSKVEHGSELESNLSDDRRESVYNTRVFSRVDPRQKLDMVSLFQDKGEIVGMTGDGVNDAPALKKANIGIAMGDKGTQVAKEVADMVLKDDRFSSIVNAIRYGRIIFGNIRKFILYQLSYHFAEIILIASISFTLFNLPIKPLQLLFLNLLSDVFPALALGIGEGSPDVMKHPPKDPQEPIVTKSHWLMIAFHGLVLAIFIIGAYLYSLKGWGDSEEVANNVAFFSLAFSQLLHVFNMRERSEHIFNNQVVKNKFIWMALVFCVAALLAAYFIPGLREVLNFVDIDARHWLLIVGAALAPVVIIQALKAAGFKYA